MSQRTSGGVYNRRASSLSRLQEQLKSGKKPLKNVGLPTKVSNELIDLTDADIKRINREIAKLTEKVK